MACRPTAVGSTIAPSSSFTVSGSFITISGLTFVSLASAPGLVSDSPTAYVQVEGQY